MLGLRSGDLQVERHELRAPAALRRCLRARQVDQHTPHRAGSDGEKVVAIVPIDLLRLVQPQECFMDERRRLKRVARALTVHVLRRTRSELVVQHGRHARVGSVVACVPGPQELRHLASW